MLSLQQAQIKVAEAVDKNTHMLTWLRCMEVVNYIYENGGRFNAIFKMSSDATAVMQWTTRSDYHHKNLSIEVLHCGRFFIHLYSHRLDDMNIIQDGSLMEDSTIEGLDKGIKFMYP